MLKDVVAIGSASVLCFSFAFSLASCLVEMKLKLEKSDRKT